MYNSMYKSIIIFSCLIGSVYTFSKSLSQIHKLFLEKKVNNTLFVVNGLTFVISSYIFIFCVKFLDKSLIK